MSFKPQRGKFTPSKSFNTSSKAPCFKPQRGKFTRTKKTISILFNFSVSNPNGVNLHTNPAQTGKHINSFKPQRGKFTLRNTDGYTLELDLFQTPTG